MQPPLLFVVPAEKFAICPSIGGACAVGYVHKSRPYHDSHRSHGDFRKPGMAAHPCVSAISRRLLRTSSERYWKPARGLQPPGRQYRCSRSDERKTYPELAHCRSCRQPLWRELAARACKEPQNRSFQRLACRGQRGAYAFAKRLAQLRRTRANGEEQSTARPGGEQLFTQRQQLRGVGVVRGNSGRCGRGLHRRDLYCARFHIHCTVNEDD